MRATRNGNSDAKSAASQWDAFRAEMEPELEAVRAADTWDTLPTSPVGRDGTAKRIGGERYRRNGRRT